MVDDDSAILIDVPRQFSQVRSMRRGICHLPRERYCAVDNFRIDGGPEDALSVHIARCRHLSPRNRFSDRNPLYAGYARNWVMTE